MSSDWCLTRLGSTRPIWLWVGVTFNVLVLAAFKFLPRLVVRQEHGRGTARRSWAFPTSPSRASRTSSTSMRVRRSRSAISGYFALYMAFFPKVLQGPIERAGDLLPQLRRRFEFDAEAWRAGAILFAWGLFKKMVVADRAGPLVDAVYGSVTSYQGPPLALATYLFAVQLYCDFSGYTDMALGIARCFGIRPDPELQQPVRARSIVEFWRRWHISFSRWIFDYLFNPLQFALRDLRIAGAVIALIFTFFVSGIWHGVGWTFVVWGLIHGIYMCVSISTRSVRKTMARAHLARASRARAGMAGFGNRPSRAVVVGLLSGGEPERRAIRR